MFSNKARVKVLVCASFVVALAGVYANDDERTDKKDDDKSRVSGKVIIVGPDGKTREFDLGGKGGLDIKILSDKKIQGRIRLALPDGEVEEVEIGGDDAIKIGREIRILRQEDGGKYMIGVAGAPVSDVLRSQLNLGKDVGLVVDQVFPGSPAEKAGLKKYDVVVAAGDRKIVGLEGLAKVVQNVGKDGKKLSLSVIRGGKEVSLSVTPDERKSELGLDLPNVRKLPIESKEIRELIERALKDGKLGSVQIEKLIPERARQELRIIRSGDQELKKQVEELKQRVKELEQAVKKLQK
jgi:hypothetical protein